MNVTVDLQDSIALITMDDGKKNAITPDALKALEEALDKAEADAGAVVLAGRPGSFCAGFDLATMTSGNAEAIGVLSRGGSDMAVRLWSYPKPLVAACTGHAFTIGAIWLACCDNRIGEQGAFQYGMVETKMGVGLPDWALAPLKERIALPEWIPAILQSRMYDSAGALAAGFLDELVPEGQSIERARTLAAELAELPGKAYADNKLYMRRKSLEVMKAAL